MREIKFRGKRTDTGEWAYGLVAVHTICGDETELKTVILQIPEKIYQYESRVVIPETIGQYTGLKDKNGVEIYEGDICVHDDYECIGKVEYTKDEAAFMFIVIVGSNNQAILEHEWLYEYADGLKVVGNIHDNPELLEVSR